MADTTIFNHYPLWIATYGPQPILVGGWSDYTFWQYTDAARVSGIKTMLDHKLTSAKPRLSERESEVLDLLAAGLGVSAIASKLYVSESTTKSHITKIYEKLGAANRAQALVSAMRLGLLRNDNDPE